MKCKKVNLFEKLIDEYFLVVLVLGLFDCVGVVIGIDRFFMLKVGVFYICEVINFFISCV